MPLLLPALAHPAAHAALGVVAATTTKKSTGSPVFFIFLIVIVGLYFLFIAPQRRKQRAAMNQQASYEVGDEVVTKGGIFGHVVSKADDRVRLEISPGTSIDVLTASIARRVDPQTVEEDDAAADEYPAPHSEDSDGDGDSSGWTEPAHEGWTEPAHDATPAPTSTGGARDDAASGGPA